MQKEYEVKCYNEQLSLTATHHFVDVWEARQCMAAHRGLSELYHQGKLQVMDFTSSSQTLLDQCQAL